MTPSLYAISNSNRIAHEIRRYPICELAAQGYIPEAFPRLAREKALGKLRRRGIKPVLVDIPWRTICRMSRIISADIVEARKSASRRLRRVVAFRAAAFAVALYKRLEPGSPSDRALAVILFSTIRLVMENALNRTPLSAERVKSRLPAILAALADPDPNRAANLMYRELCRVYGISTFLAIARRARLFHVAGLTAVVAGGVAAVMSVR